ncbi:MAG: tRNA (adenosine(37)-N6)-threonylcarbamoyltransferase complex ATPase subunit type 1 TsaE [Actinobacteria bacterium]|nr:MAG: tRNA (adenosine(37)-N6)-threonylcarbamoyltransferase complex ATPase subunit type 1 TsaE [Actinomycetota bacterium]
MLELCASSLAGTHAIAAALAKLSRPGDLILLSGEMGAGKTAFAQGFGRSLGITEPITSPTYTLVHSYEITPEPLPGDKGVRGQNQMMLHHADLYRLNRTAEVADLALEELAEYAGIVLVEWGDVADSLFGDHLLVHLEPDLEVEDARVVDISAAGARWAARWARLEEVCEEFRC